MDRNPETFQIVRLTSEGVSEFNDWLRLYTDWQRPKPVSPFDEWLITSVEPAFNRCFLSSVDGKRSLGWFDAERLEYVRDSHLKRKG